jgi:hypothetical protein
MFDRGRLIVATDGPADTDALAALKFRMPQPVEVVLASPRDLDVAIATHYPAIEMDALDADADRAREIRNTAPTSDELAALPERSAQRHDGPL